jgi:hypothetical protein
MSHHLMSYHLFLLKNISENSTSMTYHLKSRHLSAMRYNSKISMKSPHVTSSFYIEK